MTEVTSKPGEQPVGREESISPEIAAEPPVKAKPVSKDIGNWKHVLWRGCDLWVHSRTGQTLYDRDKVRKLRHQ